MSISKKLSHAGGQAGNGDSAVYVDDVFRTSLYKGSGKTVDIANGIPLSDGPANLVQGVEFSSSNQIRINYTNTFAPGTNDFWLDYWFKPHQGTNGSTQFIHDMRTVTASGAFC